MDHAPPCRPPAAAGHALALAAPAHAQSPGPDGSRLRMQLGSHLGLGWQFTPASRIGLRFSHFSNPRIKKPHPGLTMLQFTYTHLY